MGNHFVALVQNFWHNLALKYGYHQVIMAKEWIEAISVFIVGMITMYFIDSWFYFQHQKSGVVEGLSALRGVDKQAYINPKNQTELLEAKINIIKLKLFPKESVRPKNPRFARNIIMLLIIVLVIFAVLGIITTQIVTLPYGTLRDVY